MRVIVQPDDALGLSSGRRRLSDSLRTLDGYRCHLTERIKAVTELQAVLQLMPPDSKGSQTCSKECQVINEQVEAWKSENNQTALDYLLKKGKVMRHSAITTASKKFMTPILNVKELRFRTEKPIRKHTCST